jgi:transposase
MDAHKNSIQVAVLRPGSREAEELEVANRERDLKRFARKLVREAGGSEVRCCYEAGPCGFSLARRMEAAAPLICEVIAPSLVPVRPGRRVKTDRRDARKLVRFYRAGELTVVHQPSERDESVRNLTRCREDAKQDLLRARHRLGKMLLRCGRLYADGRAWTNQHLVWLRGLEWEHPADQVVFDDYMRAIEVLRDRIAVLDAQVAAFAGEEPYKESVGWLRCFYGIDTVTALTFLVELGDLRRFAKPTDLMGFIGMVPSEWSSGDSQRRGALTKTGNAHVRRVLIEAAWQFRHKPSIGRTLRRRREGQPGWAIAIADRAHARLYKRYWALLARGKPLNKVVVAIARELIGFLWSILREGADRQERATSTCSQSVN